ncbi:MAG TPA: deoxyribose-phosphate aldolase [Chloroflexi bacterium]|mgnify:CR=1 FL=1|nr:deoxyribose-phosphate aldolase [Chloroflexota bacterium]
MSKQLTTRDIAAMIDHSILKPSSTLDELAAGLELAKQYETASCCVRSMDVARTAEALAGTNVLVCTVIGFPHGVCPTEVKVFEANRAMDDGAVELDMVLPVGMLKSGEYAYVEQDIGAIVDAAHARQAIVKVILENYDLTDEEKIRACKICEQVGADYVKTSTGFAGGGATLADVRLMRRTCGPQVAVKAAGGIRTLEDVLQYRAAGATRIGTSSTQAILEQAAQWEQTGRLKEWEEDEIT